MQQITTPTTLPSAQRNALVVAANIQCQAIDCDLPATRWSNLCGLCEKRWLEDHKPVFGKPTPEQLTAAQQVMIHEALVRGLVAALPVDVEGSVAGRSPVASWSWRSWLAAVMLAVFCV